MSDDLSALLLGAPEAWVLVALLAGIVELITPVFGFVFVSLAALVAAAAAALGAPFPVQLVLFAATVLGSLVVLRPRLASRLDGQGVPSRVEGLVGRVGRVTVALDPLEPTGRVLVDGADWAARAEGPVPAGAEVRVRGADGIVLLVDPV